MTRRPLTIIAVALAFLVPMIGAGSAHATTTQDALTHRVRSELSVFTSWLAANNAKGYIGEVGWPNNVFGDSAQWNALGSAWFRDADAAHLWVTGWATGEWWGTSYKLAIWDDLLPGLGVDSASTQASVFRAHPTTSAYMRGVNVAGGEFGSPVNQPTSSFSNANPGVYDRNYHYESQATFNYLASQGVKLVRIPFRWERLQPVLGQSLNQTEVGRLVDVVARARAAGLQVILDMHNYGAYYLSDGTQGVRRAVGSAQVSYGALADAWRRISIHFKSDPGVVGYGLMNEPVGLSATSTLSPAQVWEHASQAALNAIRANGDGKLVLVSGYDWSGVRQWATEHPHAWVSDPSHNFRYEAHAYFDRDNSGTYVHSYADELADAKARGY
jgi:aryl-phospho-beta-D-glucosidase BglC (GH1 family)